MGLEMRLQNTRQKTKRASVAAAAVLAIAALAAAPGQAGASPNGSSAKSPATAGNALHGEQTTQGVVQSVSAKAVVLKTLDGSTVTIPVDARTRVLINGKPALLREIKPGFVVSAQWKPGRATQVLQALDPARKTGGSNNGKSADHRPS
jgi:hypothetical protein